MPVAAWHLKTLKMQPVTALTLPLLAWQEPAALLPMSALTALIVWRHRGNLRDLMAGRERHF